MICKCLHIDELKGVEAEDYAKEHLKLRARDQEKWQEEYECPSTGKRWLMEFPLAEAHGGGPARLRRM
jgi:hypothetical protein